MAMKLAEALILRADAQKRVEQLKQRLARSARVQEGEQPPEDPAELLAELDRTLQQLTDLIKRINKTNAASLFSDGHTLADRLAERDVLLLRRSLLTALIEATTTRLDRFTRSEVKYYSTVDVGAVQHQIDELAKQHRELDTQIQEANWRIELSE
jgi:hypothetical protein